MVREILYALNRQGKSCCNGGYRNTGLCRQLQEGVSDALQYIGLGMNNSVTDPSEMQLEQGLYYLAPDFPLGT